MVVAVGVEEEFHVVDVASRSLVPRARAVLDRLPERGFTTELQQSIVEANSRPHRELAALLEDLTASRQALNAAAEPLGLAVVAAGTTPLASLGSIDPTDDPRYRRMAENYRVVAEEQLICGAQVHVDIPDRDTGVIAMGVLAPWLPVLLALSASSPFWLGSDTGYASWRTLLWQRWPTTGPAGSFGSAAEYDATIAALVRSGVISDTGMVYYDVRPSAHLQTLELRICDACPRAETVVMIAGLFRALVIDACAQVRSGARAPKGRHEWLRAATWRAARSGLEGDLIDPADGRPLPAQRVVRSMLTRLRPALEQTGDWETVVELSEAALGRGSAAHRLRREAADGGRSAAVDLLIAETRGERQGPRTVPGGTLMRGYRAERDEAVTSAGEVRESYRAVLDGLQRQELGGLRARVRERDARQWQEGVTYRADGEDRPRLFSYDVVPRLVDAQDWALLGRGVAQRVRALEAFAHDAYGERAAVRDGVLPARMVEFSAGLREAGRTVPRGAVRIGLAGMDLVRDAARGWLVLEDNLRAPAGIGYALAARRFGVLEPGPGIAPLDGVPALLLRSLRAAAPRGAAADPVVGVVSDGPDSSTWYEHLLLARGMGVALHTPADLVVEDGGLVRARRASRTGPDDAPVPTRPFDVLHRRIDEDDLAKATGADGRPLWPGLLAAVEGGTLALANAPGNGVADDKALYACVPRLIRYYLGEEPELEQVPTLLPSEPGRMDEVLDRLSELVVKPVDGQGGAGVVIGPYASPETLARLRAALLEAPDRWVAQDVVALTSHPTFDGELLEPRVVDLRMFTCVEREGDGPGAVGLRPTVLPAALTRVAAGGSLIVNSSRGGGAKDTWIQLTDSQPDSD
ncbi:glutamate--cysteine ligase [Streptacidiphilus sp. N1-12]|uniref:Glutamate--cysteine ligase n=2 Tax=Streptacidiphilus alkalitolerans TaxID=3342712 RepID=A0ABV6VC38_9ACTN